MRSQFQFMKMICFSSLIMKFHWVCCWQCSVHNENNMFVFKYLIPSWIEMKGKVVYLFHMWLDSLGCDVLYSQNFKSFWSPQLPNMFHRARACWLVVPHQTSWWMMKVSKPAPRSHWWKLGHHLVVVTLWWQQTVQQFNCDRCAMAKPCCFLLPSFIAIPSLIRQSCHIGSSCFSGNQVADYSSHSQRVIQPKMKRNMQNTMKTTWLKSILSLFAWKAKDCQLYSNLFVLQQGFVSLGGFKPATVSADIGPAVVVHYLFL